MTFDPTHYNAVFDAMRQTFGEDWYASVDWPVWGKVWRHQIKSLFFEQDILIREMTTAMREACDKRQWPSGTAFFVRLRDVCLKNRQEEARRQSVGADQPESMAALLEKRKLTTNH